MLLSWFVHLSVCRGGGEAVVKVLVKYDPAVQYSKGYRPVLLGALRMSLPLSCCHACVGVYFYYVYVY